MVCAYERQWLVQRLSIPLPHPFGLSDIMAHARTLMQPSKYAQEENPPTKAFRNIFPISSSLPPHITCIMYASLKKKESYNVPPYSIPSLPHFIKYLLPYPVGISVDDP